MLRENAVREGKSLNNCLIDVLKNTVGLSGVRPPSHDLDELSGTWIADDDCDAAIDVFDRIDEDLWK